MEDVLMKKIYQKPRITVVRMQHSQMICISNVIPPDGPNKPAGAPSRFTVEYDDADRDDVGWDDDGWDE